MEIAGLLSAAFALGRVQSILKVIRKILDNFIDLKKDLLKISKNELQNLFSGFKYRFYNETELIDLLIGIKQCLNCHGSLNACFLYHYKNSGDQVMDGLDGFVSEIYKEADSDKRVLPLAS